MFFSVLTMCCILGQRVTLIKGLELIDVEKLRLLKKDGRLSYYTLKNLKPTQKPEREKYI
jgi:hypothetical protein